MALSKSYMVSLLRYALNLRGTNRIGCINSFAREKLYMHPPYSIDSPIYLHSALVVPYLIPKTLFTFLLPCLLAACAFIHEHIAIEGKRKSRVYFN